MAGHRSEAGRKRWHGTQHGQAEAREKVTTAVVRVAEYHDMSLCLHITSSAITRAFAACSMPRAPAEGG